MSHADSFPWTLRLEHEGYASIRVERAGRWFHFDPLAPPESDAVVVLTWNWPEHLDAVAKAIRDGRKPTVVAEGAILDWLGRFGPLEGHLAPVTLDGVAVETLAYQPIPYADWAEGARKVKSALFRPDRAVSRLLKRARLPRCAPVSVQLTLPGGQRLVHLNHALHRRTPDGWLDRAAVRLGRADWMIVGVDYGEDDAIARLVPRFDARRVLVADLVGDVRRAIGLPTGLVTPLVDRLCAEGVDAYVFAPQSSFRFE